MVCICEPAAAPVFSIFWIISLMVMLAAVPSARSCLGALATMAILYRLAFSYRKFVDPLAAGARNGTLTA